MVCVSRVQHIIPRKRRDSRLVALERIMIRDCNHKPSVNIDQISHKQWQNTCGLTFRPAHFSRGCVEGGVHLESQAISLKRKCDRRFS